MKKTFLNGSKAVVEGAIYSGCRYYYGATRPFNKDILNYSSYRFSEVNGVFTQTESERAAIGMLIGSAISGARVLTSSTTEGIFALDEGFSYLCGMEIPCVITNIMSGKLGLRNYEPTQSGYGQAVRGGTSGDYKFIVLAPSTVQETYDLTIKAFDLSDKYRNPVMLLLDSALSQNSQNVYINSELLSPDYFENKDWKLDGANDRDARTYKVYHDNDYKYKKFSDKFKMIENESLCEEFMTEDAEHIYIAFGLLSEVVKDNVIKQREKGIKSGLFRPISLLPFPKKQLFEISKKVSKITVIESNSGLMLYDVLNIVEDKNKVTFFGDFELSSSFRKISLDLEEGII
jgi:2-oxoglutarate ferredoxin oxidoreductase subunit alpha